MLLEKGNVNKGLTLIDFGFATRLQEGELLKTKHGTAYYIAPEVVNFSGYDYKCDIWSTGVILYIMLSGKPPFNGKDASDILGKIKNGSLRFRGRDFRNTSEEALDFLKRLMTFNKHERPTAQEALNDPWIQK